MMDSLEDALGLHDLNLLWQVLRDHECDGLVETCVLAGFNPYEALLQWPSTSFDASVTTKVTTTELAAYALRHAGFDVSPAAVKTACLAGDEDLCRVLLQCGGSVEDVSEGCCNRANFSPDFWAAVASGNANAVRKLASLWCFTGMTKQGKTLLQLAKDCQRGGVSEYIKTFCSTMEVVYAVLANDSQELRRLLKRCDTSKLKIDIRQPLMGGATPLFYAILLDNKESASLLRTAGANPFVVMRDDDGLDMPILFSAFRKCSLEVARILVGSLSDQESQIMGVCWFKGKNVLQVAFERHCRLEVAEVIVRKGGPHMVCDLLSTTDSNWRSCSALEDIVYEWVVNPMSYPGFRDVLALRGFPLSEMDYFWTEEAEDVHLFCNDAIPAIKNLALSMEEAVELGTDSQFTQTLDELKQLHEVERNRGHLPLLSEVVHHVTCQSCPGLPLLHFAVLHGRTSMVSSLVVRFRGASTGSVDEVRDFRRRTALHYAYTGNDFCITKCLLLAGASEHTLDADGLEPLDFREWSNLPLLQEMLLSLKKKDLVGASRISDDLRHKLATKNPDKPSVEDLPSVKHCQHHDNSTGHGQKPLSSCHGDGSLTGKLHHDENQKAFSSSPKGSWSLCPVM